jgi:DNA-binding NarL/FixJ family response regulator
MATHDYGSKGHRHPLRTTVEENRRLVLRSRALAAEIGEGFAAIKDQKAKARQTAQSGVDPLKTAQQRMGSSRRRILLVEDHPIVSLGISELINYEPDLVVAGLANERLSAMQALEALSPDLVILDLSLKERSGLEVLKEMITRSPKQRVLILSLHDESIYALRALRAGACGYVMKEEATETLLKAIRKVLDGGIYLSPAMEAHMMRPAGEEEPAADVLQTLTDRELEVLRLIGEGKTTRDIAHLLYISLKTIESHRTNIKHKLDLPSATLLVQYAVQLEHDPRHCLRPQ